MDVSVQDHLLAGKSVAPCGHDHSGEDRAVFEGHTTLAYVAARTTRSRLIAGVYVLPYHNPIWLAKETSSLDALSKGRLIVGVGVGALRGRSQDKGQNLGAHRGVAVREFDAFGVEGHRGRMMDEYIRILCEEMLPAVAERGLAEACDVFCEEHVFTTSESRKILTRARELGLALKLHADEIKPTGGAELAAEMKALSADHLVAITLEGMERMRDAGVIPILLPGTSFFLGLASDAPGARMLELGHPGGPLIDQLARGGDPAAIHFTRPVLTTSPAWTCFSS